MEHKPDIDRRGDPRDAARPNRGRFSNRDHGPEAFLTELLGVVEIDEDERIVALVSFDPDDIDAAYAELDARYLAGEAADHARAWSVITGTYAAVNQRQLPPMTPDFVFIDHLPLQRIEADDLTALIRAMRDLPISGSTSKPCIG